MAVRRLLLAGLEAVEVAEQPLGGEQVVLLHLRGGEPRRGGEIGKVVHGGCVDACRRERNGQPR
jgi:hypothetical protein